MTMTTRTYTIDATGKRLGRVATEAARILLGKDSVEFVKNIPADVTVKIENVAKLDVTPKKGTMEFQSYSGFPGGRSVETLEHLRKRRGMDEVVRRVVSGMLPKNKLHKPRMKNLVVTE